MISQGSGGVVPRSLAEEEPDGLDNCHQGKGDTHRSGGTGGVEFADKEGVRHIVNGGDQHTDDGGNRQLADQLLHRRLRHLQEFFLCA